MARDRGGPALSFQMLLCPMLDDREVTSSSVAYDDDVSWGRSANDFAWRAFLGAAKGTAGVSPYAAAARAADLSGLPPTFVDVGELEVFRDECIDYAQRLLQAGVSTELHVYPGAYHCFDRWVPGAAVSVRARAQRTAVLHRVFAVAEAG